MSGELGIGLRCTCVPWTAERIVILLFSLHPNWYQTGVIQSHDCDSRSVKHVAEKRREKTQSGEWNSRLKAVKTTTITKRERDRERGEENNNKMKKWGKKRKKKKKRRGRERGKRGQRAATDYIGLHLPRPLFVIVLCASPA